MAKKGRLTSQERDLKQGQGRGLYIKGYSAQTICEIIAVSVDTVNKWKKEGEWDRAKDTANISISEIEDMILQNIKDLKDGIEPKYSADMISKLVSAFEKISDKRKFAVYSMDAFNRFSDFVLAKAAKKKGKERMKLVDFVKEARGYQDEFINELLSE